MQHWLQLATRNWRAKRVRTLGAVLAIALGTGAVVWVTCCYESVRQTVLEWASSYVGNAHITVQSPLGQFNTLPMRLIRKIEAVPNVAHVAPLLVQRLPAAIDGPHTADIPDALEPYAWSGELDLHGIDLEREFLVRDEWLTMLCAGRMLSADDELACVLEASVADEAGIGVGDSVLVWGAGVEGAPTRLQVVGLVQRRRIARFLKGIALVRLPVLQQITLKFGLVTSLDVVLADPSKQNMLEAAGRIRTTFQGDVSNAVVRSASARLTQVQKAQDQQQVVLILLSCVAMLTALFIILSTLSMGMIERITQLGLLRCVGTTRRQLASLTLMEVVPLGVVGVVLGVPVGLLLTVLTVQLVPEYVGHFTISWVGILLACGAGMATVFVAATLPAVAAVGVSPLEATRPRARAPRFLWLLVSFVLAIAVLAIQSYVISSLVQRDTYFRHTSAGAVVLLYLCYALAAPLLVWLVGQIAVPIVAAIVGVRLRLLQDQVGRAIWRSVGICCGLMVGLSLIVGLIVFNSSFRAGWQFPKEFPEGYIWSYDQIDADVDAAVAEVGGIRDYAAANAVNVIVEEKPRFMDKILLSMTWFLGVEPDSFLDIVHLKFIDGDEATARTLLKQGGYVLIAGDFARTRHKGVNEVRDEEGNVIVSNVVRVWFNDHWTRFRVAGVFDSPALDIAASYFQVESDAHVVATGSVVGSNADMHRYFGVSGNKLVLLNFDLPPEPVPPGWEPPASSAAEGRPTDDYYNKIFSRESRYQFFRENALLVKLRATLNAHQAFYGTARELKDRIDSELTHITKLITAVPAVALLVAAIGVANLMTANVASRTRQIATMRAVGATRGLILRLVVGEALVLGILGSALGLGLGLHLAWNITIMTHRMWGFDVPFHVPWSFVGLSALLTGGLCILAGIVPARHAARTNIIDALHVS